MFVRRILLGVFCLGNIVGGILCREFRQMVFGPATTSISANLQFTTPPLYASL